MDDNERFGFYLTNTLEMEELEQVQIPGLSSLSEESQMAGKIKKDKPILVVTGNPPYSGHSSNKGKWIDDLLKKGYSKPDGSLDEGYYKVDGKPLGEKNSKWLQDDYVKFIRFAQWKIDQNGEGILAFITNHSYLDNPTFRGMRRSLMKTFNEIYIIDLHGNSVKKETCPDGTKDENIFDIRQGVAISIFVKNKGKSGCEIKHSDLWSLRKTKYEWLSNNHIYSTSWNELMPKSDFYLFVKSKQELEKEYNSYFKVKDIFPVNSVGIVTSRDNFVTDHNKNLLIRRLRMFADTKLSDEILSETFNIKNKENWKINTIRKKIRKDYNWENSIIQINYRPFDTKWIAYLDYLIERPRKEIMRHMFKDNIGLCVGRAGSVVGLEHPWNLAFVSKDIVDLNLFYRGGELLCPLYLYNEPNEKNKPGTNLSFIFEPETKYQTRKPNISEKIFNLLVGYYGTQPTPEEIFYYIYSILYSPTYRIRYAEFLKIDFPRIPFTKDQKLFIEVSKLGKRLADLHLLDSKELDPPVAKYQGEGDNDIIEKIVYEEERKRVYINEEKYFEGINPEVWNYFIGGYKVIEKYIKSHKGKSMENPVKLCKIITAIQRTIEIQGSIDFYFNSLLKTYSGKAQKNNN